MEFVASNYIWIAGVVILTLVFSYKKLIPNE